MTEDIEQTQHDDDERNEPGHDDIRRALNPFPFPPPFTQPTEVPDWFLRDDDENAYWVEIVKPPIPGSFLDFCFKQHQRRIAEEKAQSEDPEDPPLPPAE